MSEINNDAPLYDTVKSREEDIKKNEALLKLREDRKRYREVYRVYKAGINENLLQNVQALEKVKTEAKQDQDLSPEDKLLMLYEDLGLFEHRIGSLPKKWQITHTCTIKDKNVEFKINDKPVIIDPFLNDLRIKPIHLIKNLSYY